MAQSRRDSLILDSIKIAPRIKFIDNLVKRGVASIKASPEDTSHINQRSEDIYKKNEGKVIRHIYIKRIGFEEKINDTGNKLLSVGVKLMNDLHTKTKEWVIRNNLFVKEGDTVQGYKIADNERFLRNLPFIHDARIYIRSYISMPDTVDLIVLTKDLFSINGGLDFGNPNHVKGNVEDVNLFGMGQKFEFDGLLDQERAPKTGYQLQYKKTNMFGSFIDGTLGYSVIAPNSYDQREEVGSYFAQLDKPLISPYSTLAGGVFVAHQFTTNQYPQRPDSLYYNYKDNIFDTWIGLNLASNRLLNSKVRDRRILAVRYAQNYYDKVPYQVGDRLDLVFNDVQLVLGSLTFFRQDFYKTNYIYGFGVTEDIPYGYKVSVTSGWYRQLSLERPYLGLRADRFIITDAGEFCRYFLRTGGFYNNGNAEDAGILVGASVYSRLVNWKQSKFREFLSGSYTYLSNIVTSEALRIDNSYGLPDFSYGALQGYQRISLSSESAIYLKYKLFGFRFAPFIDANISLLTPQGNGVSNSEFYPGIGGGVRTRNINLVFGTLELRAMYFPVSVQGLPSFKINFTSNLKYKYSTTYVSAPDIIKWNIDDNQN